MVINKPFLKKTCFCVCNLTFFCYSLEIYKPYNLIHNVIVLLFQAVIYTLYNISFMNIFALLLNIPLVEYNRSMIEQNRGVTEKSTLLPPNKASCYDSAPSSGQNTDYNV